MIKKIVLTLAFCLLFLTVLPSATAFAASDACRTSFFGIPSWYEFLPLSDPPNCEVQFTKMITTETKDNKGNVVTVVSNQPSIKEIWLIVLAIIDILSTIAGIVAVVFVIVGGFKFVTSNGSPERVASARKTLTNAAIGLIIAIVATQLLSFIAARLT
jgi:hypothetical protein